MKTTFRLVFSLLLASAVVAMAFTFMQVQSEKSRLRDDLERRAGLLAESLKEPVEDLIMSGSKAKLNSLVEKMGKRNTHAGMSVYDGSGVLLASTPGLGLKGPVPEALGVDGEAKSSSGFYYIEGRKLHLYTLALDGPGGVSGALVILHRASYIDARLKAIWYDNFIRFLTLSLLITVITVAVVRWSITGPIADFAEWLKGLRTGSRTANLPPRNMLGPLTDEAVHLVKSLTAARAAAKEEARLRLKGDLLWTAERLKEYVKQELGGKPLFVVSNREPYMHIRKGRRVEHIVPAGGVVTALDPVMRACGGIWIAHGSGDADVETSDGKGKLCVPPEEPLYTLKRVWLGKEEEEGYYYGFSNEGLWPLCHITYTRPVFRLKDWVHYQAVNRKFAEALLEEIEGEECPLILVQDYHFALLPLLIKSRRPDARVGIFWHIPWPNPEVFGICPWKEDLLLGLLGADLIGFQTQFYCSNFLETVDRTLESRIDWNQLSVRMQRRDTTVKQFPISVAFPGLVKGEPAGAGREEILREMGVQTEFLGVGVDRIDYTKGIVERFRAVERFLEKYPDFIGRFTFVELGSPSRTLIKKYHDLVTEVEETAERINWRFQTGGWRPIALLKAHHGYEEIYRFYRASHLCMVTSLHDGMNLVAKEFVTARPDGDGVLILSRFAGAARELKDALIVNPYDVEEMAEAIHAALVMERGERAERMRNMREAVRERNIYRWAAGLISALARVRLDKNESENPKPDAGISV